MNVWESGKQRDVRGDDVRGTVHLSDEGVKGTVHLSYISYQKCCFEKVTYFSEQRFLLNGKFLIYIF